MIDNAIKGVETLNFFNFFAFCVNYVVTVIEHCVIADLYLVTNCGKNFIMGRKVLHTMYHKVLSVSDCLYFWGLHYLP